MNRILPIATAALVALAVPRDAAALSCEEIMNMLQVRVPANIVIQTMKDSGDQFTSSEVRCLQDNGAPTDVVSQARQMIASEPDTSRDDEPVGRRTIDDDDSMISSGRRGGDDMDFESDEPTSASDPEALKEAIKYIKANKPLTASAILFELLEDNAYPDQRDKINYYMGDALSDLAMYHTAQYHYLQVIRIHKRDRQRGGSGSAFFEFALAQLVKISRLTGDDYDLAKLAASISPEDFPRGAKNHFYYLKGIRAYTDGDLAGALQNFQEVSSKSDHFLRSLYFEGVINMEQRRLKNSVKKFRDVYREEDPIFSNEREKAEMLRLQDLSLLNIARVYFSIERYDEADKYYTLVDRGSSHWPEAMFEQAYSNFMLNDLNRSLGMTLTVNSPFFANDVFLPESRILRALTFFNLCQYGEVEEQLLAFEAEYTPLRDEMKDFVAGYASEDGRRIADQAWNTYFGQDNNDGSRERYIQSSLPKSLFNKILRNSDLNGLVRHMDIMDDELELIADQRQPWPDSVGVYLKRIIAQDRAKYERRAGLLLLQGMAREANYVSDLLTQSEIIRFEVIDAQRIDYAYRADNVDLIDSASLDIDFAVAKEIIYWPFNGEFWQDELGYYNYTEQATCN
jgi:tetratricopeptide (TPR) repeat protein